MIKYITFAALFFMLMALNVAGIVYIVRDLDGSTVTTKHGPSAPPQR